MEEHCGNWNTAYVLKIHRIGRKDAESTWVPLKPVHLDLLDYIHYAFIS
jgi:hypothetical protein